MTPRRVVVATFGSLGDLFPYLALGTALRARGHDVTVATTALHRRRVEEAGLRHHPLRPDPPDDPDLFARIMHPRTGPEFIWRDLVLPALRESHGDLLIAARGADLLLSNALVPAAPLVAEAEGIPWATATLQPMGYFSAHDPPVPPQVRDLVAPLHRLGPLLGLPLRALGRLATRGWSAPVRALRAELGLPPGPDPLWEGAHSPLLSLAMFSPAFAAPQRDWPAAARATGFAFWDRPDAGRPVPPALLPFLDAGPPPVVFTLGSAAVEASRGFFPASLDAARAVGRRALLLVGEAPATRAALPFPLPPGTLAVAYAPHALVLPRAAAVVHQGGIGTMAQALRSGRPSLVVPFSHDQPDNAARCVRLGVARTVPITRYRGAAARELAALLDDPALAVRAAALGATIRGEDGATTAADAVEATLATLRR